MGSPRPWNLSIDVYFHKCCIKLDNKLEILTYENFFDTPISYFSIRFLSFRIINSSETITLGTDANGTKNINHRLIRRPSDDSLSDPWLCFFVLIREEDASQDTDIIIKLLISPDTTSSFFYRPISLSNDDKRAVDYFVARNADCDWTYVVAQSSAPFLALTFSDEPMTNRPFICEIDTSNLRYSPDCRRIPTRIIELLPPPEISRVARHDLSLSPPRLPENSVIRPTQSTPYRRRRFRDIRNGSVFTPLSSIDTSTDRRQVSSTGNGRRGSSIFNSTVSRLDRGLTNDYGFLLPITRAVRCFIDFTVEGWIDDPRLNGIQLSLRTGNVFASTMYARSNNRKYFMVTRDLRACERLNCISVRDSLSLIILAPIEGISRYPSLYKVFSQANVNKRWIQLADNVNINFLNHPIPPHLCSLASQLLK